MHLDMRCVADASGGMAQAVKRRWREVGAMTVGRRVRVESVRWVRERLPGPRTERRPRCCPVAARVARLVETSRARTTCRIRSLGAAPATPAGRRRALSIFITGNRGEEQARATPRCRSRSAFCRADGGRDHRCRFLASRARRFGRRFRCRGRHRSGALRAFDTLAAAAPGATGSVVAAGRLVSRRRSGAAVAGFVAQRRVPRVASL